MSLTNQSNSIEHGYSLLKKRGFVVLQLGDHEVHSPPSSEMMAKQTQQSESGIKWHKHYLLLQKSEHTELRWSDFYIFNTKMYI